jgi:hypothetical protein
VFNAYNEQQRATMSVYINLEGKSKEDIIRGREKIVQSGNEIALRAIPYIDWYLRQMEPAVVEANARFWRQREIARQYQESGATESETESDTETEKEEEVRCVCPKCFAEGHTFVSKERAKELEEQELMENACPFGEKCNGE